MAVTATPIYPQTLVNTPITIVNADASNKKTLYTASTNGTKIEAIYVTNTDTNAYTLNLYFTISATSYLVGTINIPLSAGNTTAAPTINLINTTGNFGSILNKDANGNTYLYLASGTTLQASSTGTVTAAKTITFLSIGTDF